ncbi:L-fucose:H+ symporter permease [Mangrovimonas xylaniphaga]|uniref:L-fucose:H+ symporter permease n=1 Tax=Mangrovimonas xylaniphaga TaxID=1645915 RepID=UPI0006B54B2D|nr:L-fucose:H+ symporter permease [Mangrovimonas xylaniphaga]
MNNTTNGPVVAPKYLLPFILLSLCFMGWGIANNLTDPLVRVFKAVFGNLTTFQASLIQFTFYFGYFCMAIPGALISRKYSYKTGVLVGLGLYVVGCFLLYPSTLLQEFVFFCLSYYILACGLGILETNANPYMLSLGPKDTATKRLNLAQSFNPVGSVIGVLMCQIMIMAKMPLDAEGNILIKASQIQETLNIVIFPYLSVAGVLVLVWILIAATKMPKEASPDKKVRMRQTFLKLFKQKNYRFAVIAQFFYVGAQISVWTYTNFYIPEELATTQEMALQYHTLALILFGVFRWIFTALMQRFRPESLLLVSAIIASILTLNVIFIGGLIGVTSLIGISAFMSLMFPTIFGMGCEGLDEDETKVGSSGLIMAILGGAVLTPAQGGLLDIFGTAYSYLIPLICFIVIGTYAWYYKGLEKASNI